MSETCNQLRFVYQPNLSQKCCTVCLCTEKAILRPEKILNNTSPARFRKRFTSTDLLFAISLWTNKGICVTDNSSLARKFQVFNPCYVIRLNPSLVSLTHLWSILLQFIFKTFSPKINWRYQYLFNLVAVYFIHSI